MGNRFGFVAIILAVSVLLSSVVRPARGASGETGGSGSPVSLAYTPDRQTANYRAAFGVADSTTINAAFLAAVPAFPVGSSTDPTVLCRATAVLSARFSAAAGTTCVVRLVRHYVNAAGTSRFLGISDPITLTASSITESALFVAPDWLFDTGGATHVRVMLVSISAGNVTFAMGSV